MAILTILAVLALIAAQGSADAYRQGQEAGAFPAEIRREVGFGLLFNLAVALALVLAWLAEVVVALVRVVRKVVPPGSALGRVALALLPLLVLVIGHRMANPWLPDLLRQVASLARGG